RNHIVDRALRLKVVGGLAHAQPDALIDDLRDATWEFGVHIDASAHGIATERDLAQFFAGKLEAQECAIHLPDVAQEFLAKAYRRGILQVGAASFDDRPELLALVLKHFAQPRDRGNQDLLKLGERPQMYRRRDDVIGR